MHNDGIFRSTETKYFGENNFPAEQYKSPFISQTGKEENYGGQEITTTTKHKRGNKNHKATTENVQKISEQVARGTGTVAITAAAAVTTVAILGGVVIPKPKIDNFYIDVGVNAIVYEMEITQTSLEMDYYIVVEGEEIVDQREIESEGLVRGEVDGLTPDTDYQLSVIGKAIGSVENTTYFTKEFTTLKGGGGLPSTPPSNPTPGEPITPPAQPVMPSATFNLSVGVDDVGKTAFVEYTVNLTDQDLMGSDYQLIASVGQTPLLSQPIDLSNPIQGVLTPYEAGQVNLQVVGVINGERAVIGEETIAFDFPQGYGALSMPQIQLEKVGLVGINRYEFSYNIVSQQVEQLEFSNMAVSIDGLQGVQNIKVTAPTGTFIMDVPADMLNATVNASVNYLEVPTNLQRQANVTQQIATPIEFELHKTIVGVYVYDPFVNQVAMSFYWHGDESNLVQVTGGGETYSTEGETVLVFDRPTADTTYTYQLLDQSGQVLVNGSTVNISAQSFSGYDFSDISFNPGDFTPTYNDDGTMNLYLYVGFNETESDIFYEFELFTSELDALPLYYRSTNEYAIIENIPMESYSAYLSVLKVIDGVEYRLHYNTPSGTAGVDFYYQVDALVQGEGANKELEISLNEFNGVTMDMSTVVIYADGVRLDLDQSDYAKTDEYTYTAIVPMEYDYQVITFEFRAKAADEQEIDELRQAIDLKGGAYATVQVEYAIDYSI